MGVFQLELRIKRAARCVVLLTNVSRLHGYIYIYIYTRINLNHAQIGGATGDMSLLYYSSRRLLRVSTMDPCSSKHLHTPP